MELTYLVQGADGKQYGPVSLRGLESWVKEGRLQRLAQVRRSDMQHWAVAEDFQELQPLFASASGASGEAAAGAETPVATPNASPIRVAQMRSGAAGFFWIAGLSLLNSVMALAGSGWGSSIGLGITRIFDALGAQFDTRGKVMMLGLNLIVSGAFILFGWFAHKGRLWAFVTGMVLFALDALLYLAFRDWLGLGVHIFLLYWLYRGLAACRQLPA
jgi:hypothetical protein